MIEDLLSPRVPPSTHVTFSCPPRLEYELIGPMGATCSSTGQWQPDTSSVECKGLCSLMYVFSCTKKLIQPAVEDPLLLPMCNCITTQLWREQQSCSYVKKDMSQIQLTLECAKTMVDGHPALLTIFVIVVSILKLVTITCSIRLMEILSLHSGLWSSLSSS